MRLDITVQQVERRFCESQPAGEATQLAILGAPLCPGTSTYFRAIGVRISSKSIITLVYEVQNKGLPKLRESITKIVNFHAVSQ